MTQIDPDDDALAEAMRLSGKSGRKQKETVNPALHGYAARRRRVAALEHHVTAARDWDYEGWQQLRATDKNPAA